MLKHIAEYLFYMKPGNMQSSAVVNMFNIDNRNIDIIDARIAHYMREMLERGIEYYNSTNDPNCDKIIELLKIYKVYERYLQCQPERFSVDEHRVKQNGLIIWSVATFAAIRYLIEDMANEYNISIRTDEPILYQSFDYRLDYTRSNSTSDKDRNILNKLENQQSIDLYHISLAVYNSLKRMLDYNTSRLTLIENSNLLQRIYRFTMNMFDSYSQFRHSNIVFKILYPFFIIPIFIISVVSCFSRQRIRNRLYREEERSNIEKQMLEREELLQSLKEILMNNAIF